MATLTLSALASGSSNSEVKSLTVSNPQRDSQMYLCRCDFVFDNKITYTIKSYLLCVVYKPVFSWFLYQLRSSRISFVYIFLIPTCEFTIFTLSIWTDRPKQTVYTQMRSHRTRHFIRVYTICYTYSNILDISMISASCRMNYFKSQDKYGKVFKYLR